MTATDEKQQAREYYDAIRAILARTDITPTAKNIWIYLLDKQGKNGHSWPSFETIRTDCGIGSKSTVNESISLLTEKGLLKTTTPEHPANGKSNHYEINITGTKTVPVQKSNRYKKCTATGTKTVLQPVRKLYPNDSVNDSVNDSYTKKPFGDFVLLTDGEYQKLIERFGKSIADEKIEALNNGIGSKGYKYTSHYHTILSWHRRDEQKRGNKLPRITREVKNDAKYQTIAVS